MKLSGLGYLFKPTIISYKRPDGSKCGKSEAVIDGTLQRGYKRTKSKATKWYGCYRDENDKLQRTPLHADKGAAKVELHARIEVVVKARREGSDPFAKQGKIPLTQHVDAFKVHLAAKNSSDGHLANTLRAVRRIVEGCGFAVIADISAHRVAEWLADRRKDGEANGEATRGVSICTSNHYLRAIKSFTHWLVKDRRAREDVLQHLSRLNAATDRRHERRALTDEECARLIEATRTGDVFRRLDGESRAMLYQLAGVTGFRAGELASVTPASFNLDAAPATLTVAAAYSKHRKRDTLPLSPAIAPLLRKFIEGKEADERLWPGTWRERAAPMLRRDLAAAGIDYRDDAGHVFDFHALRGQFITSLGRAGVPLLNAQKLARHSDPKLTANVYTHLGLVDLAGAVASIPCPLALPLAPRPRLGIASPGQSRQTARAQSA